MKWLKKKKNSPSPLCRLLIPETKLRDAMELYPGKVRTEVQEMLWSDLVKRLIPGGLFACIFFTLAVLSGNTKETSPGMRRPAPGQPAVAEQVLFQLEETQKSLTLQIGAQEYEEKQIESLYQEAVTYLEQVVPGDNKELSSVTRDLFFPKSLPDGIGRIDWSTDAPWLITTSGEVLNEELTEAKQTAITAELSYGSEKRYFSRVVTVYPAEYTGEEAIVRAVQQRLAQQEEETRTSERFLLPETVLGYPVKQAENGNFGPAAFLILLAIVVPLLLYSGYFGSLDTKRKKRKEQAEGCYTEFVTKLSLLLAAGVSLRQAFFRLAEEYEEHHGPEHVLAAELKVSRQELENGHSETGVYEAFGGRIGVLAYRRMASLLAQSVSRGVQGMRNLLLQEAKEVMAQERANIKVKGEQAGTKLLGPMMGLLFLVFAILLVPAFQSF